MEVEDLENNRRSIVHDILEIRIEKFRECKGFKSLVVKKDFKHKNLKFCFDISVYPNGMNKESEGWLAVLPGMRCFDTGIRRKDYGELMCVMNVVDIEGELRFPQSFTRDYAKDLTVCIKGDYHFVTESGQLEASSDQKILNYLERSFILDRKEELLPGGVLSLRCDFYSDLNAIASSSADSPSESFEITSAIWNDLIYAHCRVEKDQRLNSNLKADWDNNCIVYDFTSKVLSLPRFHELKRRFGVYNVHSIRIPKTENPDDFEHIWMFDVYGSPSGRFLLSLDEREDSVGTRLLKSSPVIKRMVNADMRERREKRIELVNVSDQTFLGVLNFLGNGEPSADKVLDLYEFSHFYEMRNLQRACAENMIEIFNFEEIERIKDLYSDEYLSELLELAYSNVEDAQLRKGNVPYTECYN